MKPHLLLAGCVLLLGAAITPAHAKSKAVTEKPVDTRKIVQSIDAKNNAIVIENMRDNGSLHTYKIDDLTVVTVNGQGAKFADIKVGMLVDDLLERDSDDLDSIKLEPGPPPPAAPEKKKAVKKTTPKTAKPPASST